MVVKTIDWPIVLVIVISIAMLAYGMVALITENKTDPVIITDSENQLDRERWMELYEKRRAERKQEQQEELLHLFELGKDKN